VTKHQKNDRNNWKSRKLIHEHGRLTIHEFADTALISCGVCQEFLTQKLNISRIAPSWRQRDRPHVPENYSCSSI
jgi:hypothetical protein